MYPPFRTASALTFDTTAVPPEPLGILFFHSAGWKQRSKSAPVGSPFRSSKWTSPVAFRVTSFRASGRPSLGRASSAGDRTRSGVGYGHDAVRAFETSSGGAAPVPAGRRRRHSYRRLLDAVPAPPRPSHAPKPRNRGRARLSWPESRRILGLLRERGHLHQAKYSRLKTQVETRVPPQFLLRPKPGGNKAPAPRL